MRNTKELVHKPNQTIMFTNGKLTANQRKAYNVILYKAWSDLKLNKNQTVFEFELSVLKQKAGIKATDNWHLKKDMEDIIDIKVENVKENFDWAVFSLISYAGKSGDILEIELPKPIREALINNNCYTTLDLLIIKCLEGKYAIILYEIAIKYQKKEIPEMTIEELRLLTGTTESKSYDNFGLFKRKVLIPAIEEINSKTDILLDYTTTTIRKKVIKIKFTVKSKENRELILASDETSATLEITPGQMTLDEALEDAELKENISKILEPLGVDAAQLTKFVNDIDIEMLKKYVTVIQKNKDDARTKIGTLIYAFKHQMTPESVSAMIKASKKKPSNRENFDQREYTDDYFDNFFSNQSK